MARSRNIKPGFFTNDVLGELPALTRLLFAGIWTLCDREGRLEDRPKKIKAEVLPYDNCDPEAMLQDLEQHGFIRRYAAGGFKAIQVVAWKKHQNPHVKEAASTIPAPCMHGASTVHAPDEPLPEPEQAGLIPSPLIPDSSPLIPTSEAKASGAEAPTKSPDELTKDELWSAGKSLLEQSGMPAKQCGTFVGKLVKDYDADTVIEAVRSAVVERPADAAAYLRATCKHLAGQRKPAQPISFADHDELKRRRRWEEMTGRKWPTDGDVIDITPDQQRISA